jgi:hypothetical protein
MGLGEGRGGGERRRISLSRQNVETGRFEMTGRKRDVEKTNIIGPRDREEAG